MTPHLGASTVEAQENVAIDVSEQVLHILRDKPFMNAVNMPPIPADVLNKLQPYFKLGEKLGSFVAQLTEGAVEEITVSYAGELAEVDTQPLTRYIVRGVLVPPSRRGASQRGQLDASGKRTRMSTSS